MIFKTPINTFHLPLRITEDDIDELNHVNNVVYLRWVQDAAAAHWNELASDDIKSNLVWVVMRHEIDYFKSAIPGDEIEAVTWVGEHEGSRSIRYVQIFRRGGVLLAQAKTTWCMLDAKTLRPKRIDEEILKQLNRNV
jgi:acyl-CoA thioester hydrolase